MGKGALGLLSAYWPEDTPRYAHTPLKAVNEIVLHPIAAAAGDRPAIVTHAGPLRYGDLSDRVRRVARSFRSRIAKGSRVAIALADPAELVTAMLGAFEAEVLAWISPETPPRDDLLAAFSPNLIVGDAAGGVAFGELLEAVEEKPKGRPDYRAPILALATPGERGEALHNQKTLAAMGIGVGGFYMIEAETTVVVYERPGNWLWLALVLGTLQRGGTVYAAWGSEAPPLPARVDYVVVGWEEASRRFVTAPTGELRPRIAAGAIIGVQGGFSLSRRRRLARRLGTPVLTLLGRNDLGPIVGSHPTWFLDDAVGIPLPNVDTRPLNPKEGSPLNIGWDAVEEAEIGIKSAFAPAGGALIEGWLRTELVALIDPTGLYFLRPEPRFRPVV